MSTATAAQTKKTTRGRPARGQETPIELILDLHAKRLSVSEIARLTGRTPATISQRLTRYATTAQRIESYKRNRADLLAGLQIRIVNNLTDEKLAKTCARDLSWMYAVLFDKERLERGQSTANVSTSLSVTLLESAAARLFKRPKPAPEE